jgi:hypothetical protein
MDAIFLSGTSGDVLYAGYSSEIDTTGYPYKIGFIMQYPSTNLLPATTTVAITFSYMNVFTIFTSIKGISGTDLSTPLTN